mmetsp:Transcript_135613/g.377696  ORF Transcript_135613/g.377696 Transcript_135613/m.377696 type:complete len:395 (-) Transcript_135613:353-1537(-)
MHFGYSFLCLCFGRLAGGSELSTRARGSVLRSWCCIDDLGPGHQRNRIWCHNGGGAHVSRRDLTSALAGSIRHLVSADGLHCHAHCGGAGVAVLAGHARHLAPVRVACNASGSGAADIAVPLGGEPPLAGQPRQRQLRSSSGCPCVLTWRAPGRHQRDTGAGLHVRPDRRLFRMPRGPGSRRSGCPPWPGDLRLLLRGPAVQWHQQRLQLLVYVPRAEWDICSHGQPHHPPHECGQCVCHAVVHLFDGPSGPAHTAPGLQHWHVAEYLGPHFCTLEPQLPLDGTSCSACCGQLCYKLRHWTGPGTLVVACGAFPTGQMCDGQCSGCELQLAGKFRCRSGVSAHDKRPARFLLLAVCCRLVALRVLCAPCGTRDARKDTGADLGRREIRYQQLRV